MKKQRIFLCTLLTDRYLLLKISEIAISLELDIDGYVEENVVRGGAVG